MVVHYAPQLEAAFHRKKKRPGDRWRLDDTNYVKVKRKWKYFYRAVDEQVDSIDFLLTAKRDKKAARRFLANAIDWKGKPGLINIDKSSANTASIQYYNHDRCKRIKIRPCKYLNNIVEKDHRRIKRRCRAMLDVVGICVTWITRFRNNDDRECDYAMLCQPANPYGL